MAASTTWLQWHVQQANCLVLRCQFATAADVVALFVRPNFAAHDLSTTPTWRVWPSKKKRNEKKKENIYESRSLSSFVFGCLNQFVWLIDLNPGCLTQSHTNARGTKPEVFAMNAFRCTDSCFTVVDTRSRDEHNDACSLHWNRIITIIYSLIFGEALPLSFALHSPHRSRSDSVG